MTYGTGTSPRRSGAAWERYQFRCRILGLGRIGQETGKIAKALGMRVLAADAHETEAGRALAEYVPLDTLLAASDVISLHCPLTPETEGIINRDSIAKMRDGVILINNSRKPLMKEQDLADAPAMGKVAAADVDVVSAEPIRGDSLLLKAPNCIITPHIAWSSRESRGRLMDMAVANLRSFVEGRPQNVVNGMP